MYGVVTTEREYLSTERIDTCSRIGSIVSISRGSRVSGERVELRDREYQLRVSTAGSRVKEEGTVPVSCEYR